MGISGQMHGLVMLDKEGNLLRRSIIWCDQRTAAECEEITQRVGQQRLLEITANPALTGFTASKILWVRNHQPELYAKCAHILLPKDYVRYMLTGEFATEVSDASGMQLLDVPGRCWSQEVLEKLDIDPALLAKVYESPEVTGEITSRAAELTGLKAGTPWWAAPATTLPLPWAPAWSGTARPSPPLAPPAWCSPTPTTSPSTPRAVCTPSAAPCPAPGT